MLDLLTFAEQLLNPNAVLPAAVDMQRFVKTLGYTERCKYIESIGFVLPCVELLDAIEGLNLPVVSVGCGTGYIEKLISNRGIDIIATDKNPIGVRKSGYKLEKKHIEVVDMNASKAVTKFTNRLVMTSWPCYHSDWSTRMLRRIQSGSTLLYIGEGAGGCTGTDSFHEYLYKNFEYLSKIDIPQFDCIHDGAYRYVRK